MTVLFKRMTAPEPAPPWSLAVSLITLVLALVFMTAVAAVIGTTLFAANVAHAALAGWISGGVLVLLLVFMMRRTPEQVEALRLYRPASPFLIPFGLGLGVVVTLDLIGIAITGDVLRPPELALMTAPTVATWTMAAVLMLVVQPLAEELVFRGVLFPALRAAQNVWAAWVLTSLFYGVFHQLIYPHPTGGTAGLWVTLVEPTLIGFLLGGVRAYTHSTRDAVVAHVGVGVFALLKTALIAGGAA